MAECEEQARKSALDDGASRLKKLLASGLHAPFRSILYPVGYHYRSCEQFVSEHGRSFVPQALTDAEQQYVDECRAAHEPKPGNCYENSQVVLFRGARGRRLYYVEGFCRVGDFWYLHGWLALDGKVLDVTEGVFGTWEDDREYVGVTFPKALVAEHGARQSVYDRVRFAKKTPLQEAYAQPEVIPVVETQALMEKAFDEVFRYVDPAVTRTRDVSLVPENERTWASIVGYEHWELGQQLLAYPSTYQ